MLPHNTHGGLTEWPKVEDEGADRGSQRPAVAAPGHRVSAARRPVLIVEGGEEGPGSPRRFATLRPG